MAGLGRFFSVQFRRQFCISPGPKKLSPLAALRRKTGYPLSKCKEALVRHGNDLETAEKWLREQAQREGWAKSDQGRPTQEGVIATLVWGNTATMMEVNCETDFVAKNEKFLEFVAEVTETISRHLSSAPRSPNPLMLDHLTSPRLLAMGPASDSHDTVGDLAAENIGLFGENISLARGCYMTATTGHISSYVYNGRRVSGSDVSVGKYGSLVHVEGTRGNVDLETVGYKLGQHIVGMNPRQVGDGPGVGREEVLIRQMFLLDGEVSVEAWLESHGVRVMDFIRYAVGEKNEF